MMKKRIWELDAFRGLCLVGMVLVHTIYDLTTLYALVSWGHSPVFGFVKQWGGVLFVLVSGICVTLGSHHLKRGFVVFMAGMLCTAVTAGLYLLGLADRSLIITFGVLHCLGACMMLWQIFRRLPPWGLGLLGAALAAAGFVMMNIDPSSNALAFLGLANSRFISADYFPLTRNLGFFLLGAALGKTLYGEKKSLFPDSWEPPFRFFSWCGRNSLWIYLLHQPVLLGLCSIVAYFR